jgi:serine/threonine-protein kinase
LLESIDTLMRDVARVPSLAAEARGVAPEQARVGLILGERYQLQQLLGRGGMGAVYAACNLRTRRDVAIKVLERDATCPRQREAVIRFLREARAAARIHHPNVVDLYDVDCDQGLFYIVMERLHGESLRARLARGALEPRSAARIMRDAMHGIAEAHRRGVIHRDIKPDNVFLVSLPGAALPDPDPRVKVLDFGVSRIVESPEVDLHSSPLTGDGQVLGTPVYMPLEQLRCDPQLDVRADVFALGVTFYELLSGVRPYDSTNDWQLLVRQLEQPIPSLLGRVQGLDPALNALVMCALHPQPEARYPSVESFAFALTAWLESHARGGEQEPVRVSASAQRRPFRRHVLVGLLLVASTLVGASLLARSTGPRPLPTFGPELKARQSERRAAPQPPAPPTIAPPETMRAETGQPEHTVEVRTRSAASYPRNAPRPQRAATESTAEKARQRETLLLPSDF